jgi:hypothetical protein
MASPFYTFKYELGTKYICENFDESPKNECSKGFYATDLDGLIYSYRPNRKVFNVEVSGKAVEIDCIKRRYECIKLIQEIQLSTLQNRVRKFECNWNLYESLWPVNPFEIDINNLSEEKAIEKLHQWASVRDSVWDSVEDSVRDSVEDSVWASVRASVWDSVEDSVWAYISSLFPNTTRWQYIDHEKGVNPFQFAIALWRSGLVPSFDGKTWRLHNKNGIIHEEKI